MRSSLIGRKLQFRPAYMAAGTKIGTIVWVHPCGRFVVVEHECLPGLWRKESAKIRECLLYPTDTGLI